MDIKDRDDKEIQNFIANYREAGKTEGGIYSLEELLLEDLRRRGGTYSGREVTEKVLSLAKNSSDGRTTYGELWERLYPEEKWTGQNNIKTIGKNLNSAIYYCVTNGLPVVSVLVVPATARKLTDKAVSNIYETCKELGVDTGPVQADFIQRQTEKALKLIVSDLPSE